MARQILPGGLLCRQLKMDEIDMRRIVKDEVGDYID